MRKSPSHGGLVNRKRCIKNPIGDSSTTSRTASSPRKATVDLTSVKNRFKHSHKTSGQRPPLEQTVGASPDPIVRPALVSNDQSPFNKMPISPLVSLGPSLDPFRTMFQATNPSVSIEQLRHKCMYDLDRNRSSF
jgi:hypothetical protein